jgi:glutamyl-tRNA synthetase
MDEQRMVRGRFAPSPTGELHLGNVWTALWAWVHTRQHAGTFVLRVEDLDPDRSRPALAQQQMADLRWLGLDWDEGSDMKGSYGPYTQSERKALYDDALARLAADDLVYPCYCTRAELRSVASAPHGAEERGDYYPGTCRKLSSAERSRRAAGGRVPALRLRLPDHSTIIRFDDLCQGPVEEDVASSVGDFVVQRADGVHAYQLAVVVDDALMSISHVLRGADLLASTARQVWLYHVFGWEEPRFGHVPLLLGSDGHRLSKRHASLSVAQLRVLGATPADIIGTLAHIAGVVQEHRPLMPHELVGMLDLKGLGKSTLVLVQEDIIREHNGNTALS